MTSVQLYVPLYSLDLITGGNMSKGEWFKINISLS